MPAFTVHHVYECIYNVSPFNVYECIYNAAHLAFHYSEILALFLLKVHL